MDAHRVEGDVEVLALDGAHLALAAGAQDLVGDLLRIEGGDPPGEDDGAAAVVVAVGVELAHQRLAQFPADAPGGRTGHAIEQQFRFQALQGLDEQARGDLVPRQVHVERAVGLDVLQRQALQPGEFAQCAKLVEHVVDQLDGRRGDVPTPEADQVAEARMAPMATPCSAAISTVRRMLLGSPAWKPVAMLALLISGMIAASTPSPMVHGPKPSPMSELRSTSVIARRLICLVVGWSTVKAGKGIG